MKVIFLLIVAAVFIVQLASRPIGYLSHLVFGKPEYPTPGLTCELPLDWRYTHQIGQEVAVAGPYLGAQQGGVFIGLEPIKQSFNRQITETAPHYPAGAHICVVGTLTSIGKKNTQLIEDVQEITTLSGEAGGYHDY